MKKPVVISLNEGSSLLADKFAYAFDYDVVGLDGKPVADTIRNYFRDGRPIIGLCSAGILIRILAPLLKDKQIEPPVIAMAPDASAVVPLLGGHHGANRIARRIAEFFHLHPAITNMSDTLLGLEFDNPPEGWIFGNNPNFRHIVARLAEDPRVRIAGNAPWLHHGKLVETADAPTEIIITEKLTSGDDSRLVYHPKTLAVGIGCERGVDYSELDRLLRGTFSKHGLALESLATIVTIDIKEDETAFTDAFGDRVRYFSREELATQTDRIKNPSDAVMREIGIPSVAEAAALLAAGADSELIVEKEKSDRATIAIARASSPIMVEAGRGRSALYIVGLGPGDSNSLTDSAGIALRRSSDWVGYKLYLELAGRPYHGPTLHPFELGAEEERVRHAIALAKQGKQVALACSGDPAIYAMASLVYEILDREPARIAVEVIPGVSAFQAASAKAGAMIGHDFCCISLSDLLTPWEAIEKRLRAAAEGDFVVALYNPRSEKRRDHLDRAIAILRQCRPETTPVVVASNLGRKDEKFAIAPLRDFDASTVDMLTIVLVGSSQSRSFKRGDGKTYAYTPRGYAAKREASA